MHHPEELYIDTPEQIALELPLAGIGSRFLALAVDTLLQALLYVALGLVAAGFAVGAGLGWAAWFFRWFGTFAPAVLLFAAFCVYWGYFAVFEAVWKGQTPGKRFAGIRVLKESGRPINAVEATARNLMRAVDGLPVLYGVGIVVMTISREHRRLGDYVAGTVVVHDKATDEVRPYLGSAGTPLPAAPETGRITSDELLLIETYLHRRTEFDAEVRTRTAREIAERIRAKLGLRQDAATDPDAFLETIARQTRDGARFR